ncbi:hypothetical protein E2C01_046569 [Portunus trituberculatus]|uniref:Uncharacterized protein n=1 Tax=Portunus trituberculatus TaxID=210409 RepID=A0A5B7G635_PORTR|nr:hypothetical protein [Portunus trituberculatus]
MDRKLGAPQSTPTPDAISVHVNMAQCREACQNVARGEASSNGLGSLGRMSQVSQGLILCNRKPLISSM